MNNYIDKIKKEQRTIRFYRIFLIMFLYLFGNYLVD